MGQTKRDLKCRGVSRNFKGGCNLELRQLKHFGETSFFACISLCRASPSNLCVSLHFTIKYFGFLYIGVSRPSVAFYICSVRQFNATLYLFRNPIVYNTKNVKTKHIHTSNQLHSHSFLALKKSTGTTSISLINLYSGIL